MNVNPGILGKPTYVWTLLSSGPTGSYYYNIFYADGYWVVVGNSGYLAYATDPLGTWTQVDIGFGTNNVYDCEYGNGIWTAVGDGYIATATTPSGTWTTYTGNNTITYPRFITYANGYWLSGGSGNGSNVYATLATATTPGGTWTTRFNWSNIDAEFFQDAVYNSGWVVTGDDGGIFTASDPTSTWTQQTSGTTQNLGTISYGAGLYMASAYGEGNDIVFTSTNKTTWTTQTTAFGAIYEALACNYGNSHWVVSGTAFQSSPNGTTTWNLESSNVGAALITDVAYGNDNVWIAVGEDRQMFYAYNY